MPVEYVQIGGYTGSYAGDCAIFKNGRDRCVIDTGRDNQANEAFREICGKVRKGAGRLPGGYARPDDLRLLVTHFHDDHVDRGKSWNDYSNLGASLYYGDALSSTGKTRRQDALGSFDTCTAIDGVTQIYDGTGADGWGLQIKAINPVYPAHMPSPGENDASLVAIIQVFQDGVLRWSQLSLGDATLRSGNARAIELAQSLAHVPHNGKFDSVKLSHHGSEDNFLPMLDDCIGDQTQIVISGYTLTGLDKLDAKINTWKPGPSRLFLFDPSIRPIDCLGEANMKKLFSHGFSFVHGYRKSWP